MRTLFKYYNNLDRKYFIKPTIKISSATKLNDPFEKIVPKDLMECALGLLSSSIKSRGGDEGKKDFMSAMNTVSFENLICRIGVVSLTETPRNILMWSHYANNHKGLCIGYRSDFLDHHKKKEHPLLPTEFTPLKVNYDDNRYDEHIEKFDHFELGKIRKGILKRTLLQKSNDWLYEKEYRSIIPLEYNDQAICLNGKKADDYIEIYNDFIKINDTTFKPVHRVSYFSCPIYHEDDLMFTLDIEPSSIEYIYFGCESCILNEIKIYNTIKRRKDMAHIKIFKMEANKNRFELNPILFEKYLEDIKNAKRMRYEAT